MTRIFTILFLLATLLGTSAYAQETSNREATGGAQTLEDILARQKGEDVPDRRRDLSSAEAQAAGMAGQLGTLGGASDADLWTALRYGDANITVSTGKAEDAVLVQDGGMRWYQFRAGPLREYGGYLLAGMLVLLALFYLLRGKIRIEGGRSGETILRFKFIERSAHWLLAGSFILLGITGLVTLFGRVAFIPLFGHEAFSTVAIASKWIHNWVAWGFMMGLILIFVMWVAHNIPNRHDLVWLSKGGGLFSKGTHPPARKFNAGQKIIFWAVIILGVSVSASGLSLLMPFEFPMFAKTFGMLNNLGLYHFTGEKLPTELGPTAEMQLASLWHAIISFIMMAIIFAHIYLGSVGMEGAFDAMGKGEVDRQWAKEHHGLWVAEEDAKKASTPAE